MGFKIKVSHEEYQRRIALPLSEKIKWAQEVIIEFWGQYHKNIGGKGVYVSFSGGKDSQVLLHLVRGLFPDTPAVFADTKIEDREIRAHVKTFDNVVWVKPKKMFKDVVKEDGFAVGSKKIARMINDLQNPRPTNENSRRLYEFGIKTDGTESKSFKLPEKWLKLKDAPFKVSGQCCDIFKKEPFRRYEKETGRRPISGTTAVDEGDMRRISYLQTGCNSFGDKGISRPLSIWTEQDIWDYADLMGLRFCEIYYDRTLSSGIRVQGEKRTGCVSCLFGITEEKGENRIQRLYHRHPEMHKHLIEDSGMKEVLNFIGVPYKPEPKQMSLFY